MDKILRVLAVGLLAGSFLASAPFAIGATYTWGNVMPSPIPGATVFTTGDVAPEAAVTYGPGVSFLDYFTFDLVDPGTPGPSVSVSFELDNLANATSVVPLTVELSVFNGSGYTLLNSAGPAEIVTFSRTLATSLSAFEQYRIAISGTAPSDGTAGYSGILEITAIPEPSAFALLLAGLAMLAAAPAMRRLVARGSVRFH